MLWGVKCYGVLSVMGCVHTHTHTPSGTEGSSMDQTETFEEADECSVCGRPWDSLHTRARFQSEHHTQCTSGDG